MLGFIGDLLGLNQGTPAINAANQNANLLNSLKTEGMGVAISQVMPYPYTGSTAITREFTAAAAKAGIHAFAVEDALLRARSLFTLDDKGEAIQVGPDGAPVLGKDGKTAFTPAEWLEAMKETAPHWFPAPGSGGGANGSGGAGAGGKTIRREAFDALSAAEKSKVVKTHTIVD